MDNQAEKSLTVDDYIDQLPDEQRAVLQQVRALIKQTVPEAVETISYQMPTYKYHGVIIHFGAWKNHWGLYPASTNVMTFFEAELKAFKQSKGAIQFPWNKPLLNDLIIRIVQKRVKENLERQRPKKP